MNHIFETIKEQLGNEQFTTKVDMTVRKKFQDNTFIDHTYRAVIVWKLDVDARNWGIKDLNVSILQDVPISWIEVYGEEQEKEHTAIIPATRITIDRESSGYGIAPTGLYVTVDEKDQVTSAELTVSFPGK